MSTHSRSNPPYRWLICLVAQSGDLALGPLAQHAGTAGTLDRRVRVRPCAGGRKQRRPHAVPEPPAQSFPILVPLNRQSIPNNERRHLS